VKVDAPRVVLHGVAVRLTGIVFGSAFEVKFRIAVDELFGLLPGSALEVEVIVGGSDLGIVA